MQENFNEELEQYHKLAKQALEQYKIEYDNILFLRQSENVTFCVKEKNDKEKYLLRIHRSIDKDNEYHHNKNLINSELLLLEELNRCGEFIVQTPIKNKYNSFVTSVFNEWVDQELNVTVLKWVDGDVIDINNESYNGLAVNLGAEMGRLHKTLTDWKPPKEFVRREYSLEHNRNSVGKLGKLVDLGLISREMYNNIYKKTIAIIEFIDKDLPKCGNWGLIHGDLNEGNYIVNGTNIAFIDFSMGGFGYYLYDIAQTLMHLSIENRRLFIRGYENVCQLPNNFEKLVEAFFVLAIIENMLFLSSNKEEHEYVAKLANYLSSLSRGQCC